MEKNHIDFMQITPSRLQLLLEDEKISYEIGKLEAIMIGGENLSSNLVKNVKNNKKLRIFNMYGPTETTVWSSVKEMTDSQKVSLGDPIANTQLYICDQNNELQPPELTGELCISGAGLALGYCNEPYLTNEKFVKSPINNSILMYKTGDIVECDENGELYYKGRIDNQVKIRGFRIELGEVENAFLKYIGVKDIAVCPIKFDKEFSLAAFYINSRLISS